MIPESGISPGEVNGKLSPVFLPREFHGQRSLAGYSPLGLKELGTTEQVTHTHIQRSHVCLVVREVQKPPDGVGCETKG